MYAPADLPQGPTTELWAASLRLPGEAVFAGRTAAYLHGLEPDGPSPIEVIVPPSARVSARAGLTVWRAELDPEDIQLKGGLRATAVDRTLLDVGLPSSLLRSLVMADIALRKGLVGRSDLHEWAARHQGLKGVSTLRRVAELADSGAASPLETELRLIIVQGGLPRPLTQATLRSRDGRFLGRPDLYFPDHGVAVEFDGQAHRYALHADNQRQNLLIGAGIALFRFTGLDVRGNPQAIVGQLREALRKNHSPAVRWSQAAA